MKVLDGDFADPHVTLDGDRYVAVATNAPGSHVQVATSTDLRTWQRGANALPQLPAWTVRGFTWSPAVVPTGAGWALWYVVREPRTGRQVISVAHGDRPEGPFEDRTAAPTIAQYEQGGSIDPSPLVTVDGSAYLLWKADSNAIGAAASLWGQRLSDERDRLVGEPVRLLAHDRRWERPLIEAPTVAETDHGFVLFYSAGDFAGPGYSVGYATADDPLGPWTKQTVDGPWLATSDDGAGPGGQEVFRGLDGRWYLAYHAWDPERIGYDAGGARSLHIDVLDLNHDTPVMQPFEG